METGTNVWLGGRRLALGAAGAVLLAALAGAASADGTRYLLKRRTFTSDFRIEECGWATADDGTTWNPYFPLVPGQSSVLEGEEDGALLRLRITVCDGTEGPEDACEGVGGDGTVEIDGIPARVVEEREWKEGELVEVSRNWFSRCVRNGSVFYLGEEVDDYEGGVIVGHEGEWQTGENGAEAGVILPAPFLLGARYFQEMAPGVAMDRGENVRQNLTINTDAFPGPLTECVEVWETTPLEPAELSVKRFCPGVGLVYDDGAVLVDFDAP
jgi:hypothetical protein